MSCYPGTLQRYFVSDFEMVPFARFTGIVFVFTFHTCSISVVRSLCFRISSLFLRHISL